MATSSSSDHLQVQDQEDLGSRTESIQDHFVTGLASSSNQNLSLPSAEPTKFGINASPAEHHHLHDQEDISPQEDEHASSFINGKLNRSTSPDTKKQQSSNESLSQAIKAGLNLSQDEPPLQLSFTSMSKEKAQLFNSFQKPAIVQFNSLVDENILLKKATSAGRGGSIRHEAQLKRRLTAQQKQEMSLMLKDTTAKCIQMIEADQSDKLLNYLATILKPPVSIVDLVCDDSGCTLLHTAALQNNFKLMTALINLARDGERPSKELRAWINRTTKGDHYTALHFVSSNGNIPAAQLLIKEGADVQAVTANGLNVLHIAAQYEQPISLFFFSQGGVSLRAVDSGGSTPLHWAAFKNAQVSLMYLLAWLRTEDIQIKNNEGSTALHIAVNSSEDLMSPKIVRILLVKGADKDVKDNAGKRPLDLVPNIESPKLRQQLTQSIASDSWFDCLQLKVPLKKTYLSRKMPIAFIATFDTVFAVMIIFLYPMWEGIHAIYITLFMGLLTSILWFAVQFSNPGYMRKPKDLDFLKLMQMTDPTQLCPECFIIKTPRSFHCSTCGLCVERYDHHCVWVNNCVGIKNHWLFLSFLISLESTIIAIAISTIIGLHKIQDHEVSTHDVLFNVLPHFLQELITNKFLLELISWTILLLAGFFILPVGFLLFIQVVNFLSNKTTKELYSKKPPPPRPKESMFSERLLSSIPESPLLRGRDINSSRLQSAISFNQVAQPQRPTELVIGEFGKGEDYTGRSCFRLRNIAAMCTQRKHVDQMEVFGALVKNSGGPAPPSDNPYLR